MAKEVVEREVGDVVQLECGGPAMVVCDVAKEEGSDVGEGYVKCAWHDAAGCLRIGVFDLRVLKIA